MDVQIARLLNGDPDQLLESDSNTDADPQSYNEEYSK